MGDGAVEVNKLMCGGFLHLSWCFFSTAILKDYEDVKKFRAKLLLKKRGFVRHYKVVVVRLAPVAVCLVWRFEFAVELSWTFFYT